jgi:uncharacterized protein (UPF0303 family)
MSALGDAIASSTLLRRHPAMQRHLMEQDIERLIEQERRLQFSRFDRETAFELGCKVRALSRARGVAVAIEVRVARSTMFFNSMPGATGVNEDWIRRKRNTVEMFGQSSYRVGRALQLEGTSLEAKMGLATGEFASHGGGFPIVIDAVGCIGAVTVSGVPERQDHALVVEVLAEMCAVPLHEIALEE